MARAKLILFALCGLLLFGCGGGGSGVGPVVTKAGQGTAHFSVDVASGNVTITPLTGASNNRAVFSGTAVTLASSSLAAQPGDPGIKVLKVTIKNNWGTALGVDQNNNSDGLRVVFGPLTVQPVAQKVTLDNPTGYLPDVGGGPRPYVDYGPTLLPGGALATGATSQPKEWWFAVPPAATSFSFVATVQAALSGSPGGMPAGTGAGAPDVLVTTVAGTVSGYADGAAHAALFSGIEPELAPWGSLYLIGASRIRYYDGARVYTIAGNLMNPPGTDGVGLNIGFTNVGGAAVAEGGKVLMIVDWMAGTVRRLVCNGAVDKPTSWKSTTIAGLQGTHGHVNGPGNVARLYYPKVIVRMSDTFFYICETEGNTGKGGRIRVLQLTGNDPALAKNWTVWDLAGDRAQTVPAQGTTDGVGPAARFGAQIQGAACDPNGDLIVSDSTNYRLRKVTKTGVVTTIAGPSGATLTAGYKDGAAASALFDYPCGVDVDSSGYIYIADLGNDRIRRLSPTGIVSTVAGTGQAGWLDGTGDKAQLRGPGNVVVGFGGVLYFTEDNQVRLRRIDRLIK